MPSRFDTLLASDWDRAFSEFKETVVRRQGGNSAKTEDVEAVVDRDHQSVASLARANGLVVDETGERIEKPIALEVSASQDTSQYDSWVVDSQVWKQYGEPIGEDGGSKTIVCVLRKGIRDKEPRTVNRR